MSIAPHELSRASDERGSVGPSSPITLGDLFGCVEGNLLLVGQARNGSFVHISDAATGLACGCTCPGCGRSLVARHGRSRKHSFAHWGGPPPEACGMAGETALHRFAKDNMVRQGWIDLPPMIVGRGDKERRVRDAMRLSIDEAHLETRDGAFVPDVTCWGRGRKLHVEFHVTHSVPDTKLAAYRTLDAGVIEIDLRQFLEYPVHELGEVILAHAPRRWLHSPLLMQAEAEIEHEVERSLASLRERASRIADHWRGAVAPVADELAQWDRDASAAGLGGALALGRHLPGDAVFTVPRREWSGYLLLKYGHAMPGGFSFDQFMQEVVRRGWIEAAFVGIDANMAAAVRQEEPSFRSPNECVMEFLSRLHASGWMTVTAAGKVRATGKLLATVERSGAVKPNLRRPRWGRRQQP